MGKRMSVAQVNPLNADCLTAVKTCSQFELKAVYSRSKGSADQLVELNGSAIDVYFEAEAPRDRSLDALLSRDDIQAVMIALPIVLQPKFIKACLSAGKHVLSEKPMAPSVEICRELLAFHSNLDFKPVFMISEPIRFDPAFTKTAELTHQRLGRICAFSLEWYTEILPSDPLHVGEWRRNPEHQGGYIFDGGVHYMAAIRKIVPGTVHTVSAVGRQIQEHLPPLDTIHSVLKMNDGLTGTFALSYGCQSFFFEFRIHGERGIVKLSQMKVKFEGSGLEESYDFTEDSWFSEAMRLEYTAFANAILEGDFNTLASPEEALKDVAMVTFYLTVLMKD